MHSPNFGVVPVLTGSYNLLIYNEPEPKKKFSPMKKNIWTQLYPADPLSTSNIPNPGFLSDLRKLESIF